MSIPKCFSLLLPTPRPADSHLAQVILLHRPPTCPPPYLPHKSLTRVQAGAPKASTTTGAHSADGSTPDTLLASFSLLPRPGRALAPAHRRALRIRARGSRQAPLPSIVGPVALLAAPLPNPAATTSAGRRGEKGRRGRGRHRCPPAVPGRPQKGAAVGRAGKKARSKARPESRPFQPRPRAQRAPALSPSPLSKMAAELPLALLPPRPRRAGRWHQLVPLRSSPPPAEASHLPVWGAAGPALRPGFSRLRPPSSGGGRRQGEERALPLASARGPGAAAPPSCGLRSPAAPPRSGPYGWRRCRCRSGRGGHRPRGQSAARLPLWAAKRGGGPGPAGGSAALPGRAGFSIAHKMARVPNLRSARRRQQQGPASPRLGAAAAA